MIRACFSTRNGKPCGFTLKGHAGAAECGQDIVCAAVSSAAYMAVNTMTEILGAEVTADVRDGFMKISLCGENDAASDMIAGLRLHLKTLAEDYPDFIKITARRCKECSR